MITLVEAKNFCALRYVRQTLRRFQVLTGPNAAGKTTFLDVFSFLSDLISSGPNEAIKKRTEVFQDLVTGRDGEQFELAVEAQIPADKKKLPSYSQYESLRYEVRIGRLPESDQFGVLAENAALIHATTDATPAEFELFPRHIMPPQSIFIPGAKRGAKTVLRKNPKGNDNFYSEVLPNKGGGWLPSFKFGPMKPALANVPDDGTRFPVTLWFRDYLTQDVQRLILDSLAMRLASPPGHSRGFKLDGSNLPWVIQNLIDEAPGMFKQWVAHVRTALPDIEQIRTVERTDDKHRYLVVRYSGGVEVPSWMVSDGTLRLLALTLPAYLPNLHGLFLIEEPENGVHPKAIETVIQSLSSVYNAQVLLATHSPVIINAIELEDILCFQKDSNGFTDIVAGPNHPALREWKGETNLGLLFAAGVLG
ncbi:MAG TPA: ATP-binding protein [Tepidisphaeraceae bacterium]|jgi:predicted ATPase|nr:ATP-binding protein [Tepidisphaeraceae bacterium]